MMNKPAEQENNEDVYKCVVKNINFFCPFVKYRCSMLFAIDFTYIYLGIIYLLFKNNFLIYLLFFSSGKRHCKINE